MLRDFSDSWLANMIGVSTLAFTSDGKLLIVGQSQHNYNSPALFAPSGSGALSPDDLHDATTLAELAMAGANRELCEENGIRASEIASSGVLSFSRWLSKGAAPEFCGYSLLSVSSDDLADRQIPRSERVFTDKQYFVHLSHPSKWSRNDVETALPPEVPMGSCSIPLLVGLTTLIGLALDHDISVKPVLNAI